MRALDFLNTTSKQSAKAFLTEPEMPETPTTGKIHRFRISPEGEAIPKKEPSLLRKADVALGKAIRPVLRYSGLEGAGRLWDLPANVGYGVYEGVKQAIETGEPTEIVKEPVRAGLRTLRGEGYYDLEQAGLPVPEGKIARPAAEIAWDIAKNPLNVLVPYRHRLIAKTTPPKPVAPELRTIPEKPSKGLKIPTPEKAIETPADAFKAAEGLIYEKYKDILPFKTKATGRIYQMIDDRTLSPQALDKYLAKVDNKAKVVQNTKAVIADQIGDLIETHRYESGTQGARLEAYMDSLLEVVKKHDVSPTRLPGEHPAPGLKARQARPVPHDRRVIPETPTLQTETTGKLQGAVDFLKSERGAVEVPKRLESLKNTVERLEEGQGLKGFRATLRRTKEGLSEAIHSPERVFERDPKVGKRIYQAIDRADQQKNSFLATEGGKLKLVAGKIKEGSEASAKVGQALDGKINPNILNPAEHKLFNFMKKQYDFLIQKYARSAAGSEAEYLKVLRAANREKMPYVKVTDLPKESQAVYGRLKKSLSEIRKGRPLKALNKTETQNYWAVRKEMSGILEERWKQTLTQGGREAYDVLSKRIKDYLPHIFDKDTLLDAFKNEIAAIQRTLQTATDKGAVTSYKNRLRQLQDAVVKMEKGYLVTYESLPQYVRFRFFESRKGKAGYSFDSVKAYQTYLHGIARKLYDEPAVRQVAQLHKELDPSLKGYNKWYVRHYMGWDRNKLDDAAGAIASFQWMRTLGLNPRSAIVNLTQRLNTVAEAGAKHSLKGQAMGFTKQGSALFDSTGIAKEIPTVLLEGPVPEGMEKVRAIVGFMFNKVELGNRKHAFLSAYSKAKARGIPETEAIQHGIDIVHKTQFRYGKVGMPKALTHPVGRLAGQFWSYPIKQIELMTDWAKNNPAKLVKYLAYAEGGNYALNEFLGIDLSNALGFGLNWGEAIKAIRDVPEGDWRGFWRHVRLTFSGGGGLLPSGLGPTASGAIKVAQKAGEGKALETLRKELTPVQVKRVYQAYQSIMGKKGKRFPVYDSRGYVLYYLTAPQLGTRTVGPRSAKESKKYLDWKKASLLDRERKEVLQDITRAIVDEDTETANRLVDKYKVVPTQKMIENEILKRGLSREERKALRPLGRREEYQLQREGELYQ